MDLQVVDHNDIRKLGLYFQEIKKTKYPVKYFNFNSVINVLFDDFNTTFTFILNRSLAKYLVDNILSYRVSLAY